MLGFLFIASDVAGGRRLALDSWLLVQMRSGAELQAAAGPQWLTRAMIDFTALGGGPVLTLMSLLEAGYLVARREVALAVRLRRRRRFEYLSESVVRARPPRRGSAFGRGKFRQLSSGHATNSALIFLTLAALLISAERSRSVRAFLMAAAVLVTLLVGLSRMYLGVHWPSDVLAGWALDAAWATGCTIVAGRASKTVGAK